VSREAERGRIALVQTLTPRTRRVRIGAPSLAGCAFAPGADVALLVPAAGHDVEERRYSVARSSAADGTFDVAVVLHERGPGSRWAARCGVGDEIRFVRSPTTCVQLDREAGAHLFVGDETSVAAADSMARALPESSRIDSWFESESADDRWPDVELARSSGARWVPARGRRGAALLDALRTATLPEGDLTAYVTGETWLCSVVCAHLVRERGLPAPRIRAFPHWKERRLAS
jgi:NADPH-dependent ferric siderophore reductase